MCFKTFLNLITYYSLFCILLFVDLFCLRKKQVSFKINDYLWWQVFFIRYIFNYIDWYIIQNTKSNKIPHSSILSLNSTNYLPILSMWGISVSNLSYVITDNSFSFIFKKLSTFKEFMNIMVVYFKPPKSKSY